MFKKPLWLEDFQPLNISDIEQLSYTKLKELSIAMMELLTDLKLDPSYSYVKTNTSNELITYLNSSYEGNDKLKTEIQQLINDNKSSVDIIQGFEKKFLEYERVISILKENNKRLSTREFSHKKREDRKNFIKLYSRVSNNRR